MKIQEASKRFTKGGNMFPSFKKFYFEENTLTCEENKRFILEFALKHTCVRNGALGAQKKDQSAHTYVVGIQTPRPARHMRLAKKNHFL